MEHLLVSLGAVAGVGLILHSVASSFAYVLLKDDVALSKQLFGFPIQMPSRAGLLKLKYVLSFRKIAWNIKLAAGASRWLTLARVSGLVGVCSFAAFFVVAILIAVSRP